MFKLVVRAAIAADADLPYRYGEPALVREAIASGEAWTVFYDGSFAAIYGVTEGLSALLPPVIWGVTSEVPSRHPVLFLRKARQVVEAALARHGVVGGHVVSGCPERWL